MGRILRGNSVTSTKRDLVTEDKVLIQVVKVYSDA